MKRALAWNYSGGGLYTNIGGVRVGCDWRIEIEGWRLEQGLCEWFKIIHSYRRETGRCECVNGLGFIVTEERQRDATIRGCLNSLDFIVIDERQGGATIRGCMNSLVRVKGSIISGDGLVDGEGTLL